MTLTSKNVYDSPDKTPVPSRGVEENGVSEWY